MNRTCRCVSCIMPPHMMQKMLENKDADCGFHPGGDGKPAGGADCAGVHGRGAVRGAERGAADDLRREAPAVLADGDAGAVRK